MTCLLGRVGRDQYFYSPKRLWRTVDQLLGRGRLPLNTALTVEDVSRYFEEKVAAVQAATAGATAPVFTPRDHPGTQFSCFQPISAVDDVAAVRRLPDKI